MTDQPILLPGDIFLTQGNSRISRLIRFFSRNKGEAATQVNHTGIVVKGGTPDQAVIVEASSKVLKHSMNGYYNSKNTKVAVFRPKNISPATIDTIVYRAEKYVGMKYGYIKIVAHFLDWCLGGVYFFRRFAFMDKYPICSWVVAYAYADSGYTFGVEPGGCSPDDIWDFCLFNADKYEMIHGLLTFQRHYD
jgi:Permuted papain-like amidase enzyme, YaeF/YiiX, C92 family